jgi:hypothetical protein
MTGTSPEISAYAASIDTRFALALACVDGLTAAQLIWRPPAPEANSLWALAMHIAGNARAWICGIAAGAEIGRDRYGEFASSGDDPAALVAQVLETRDAVLAALRAISPEGLDARLVPAHVLWGEGSPREISVRDAILQVIEHASLHVGAMQLTRDLVLARE